MRGSWPAALLIRERTLTGRMRKAIAVIVGAVVGSATLFMVGFIANTISPTPPELMDPTTPEAVAQRVAATTTGTWITVILGLSLGAFLGGAVAARLVKERAVWVTGGVGLVLSLWAFYTFYVVYPAALWVPAAMLIAVFLFSNLGGRFGVRSR